MILLTQRKLRNYQRKLKISLHTNIYLQITIDLQIKIYLQTRKTKICKNDN